MHSVKFVSIVEDDVVIASFLKNKINESDQYNCLNTYLSVEELFLNNSVSDILLLDINLPGMNGVEAIEKILKKWPNLFIIMNSISDDTETIFKSLQNGAVGYIDKQSFDHEIFEVLDSVAEGGAYMTPKIARKVIENFKKPKTPELTTREMTIVNAILEGKTYQQIADANFISIDTVRSNIKVMYKKLRINSKSQLFSLFTKKL